MGTGMARRLLDSGVTLSVWNRTPERCRPLVELGATQAASCAELARASDVVISCLMDDESVLDAVSKPEGLLQGMSPGGVHVCVTTISPACADQLEQIHMNHGSTFLSAPVSGRPDAAASGSLIAYVGGPKAASEVVEPLLRSFSAKVVYVSDRPRAANCIKLAINFTACAIMEVFGEAYGLAERCGLDPQILCDWYQFAFAHPALKLYATKILKREFASNIGFPMSGGMKDVTLILEAAKGAGAHMPIAELVAERTKSAMEQGLADVDWTGFTELTRANRPR